MFYIFFFNDTATTEIYTLSLHDALPILRTSPVSGSRKFALPSNPPQVTAKITHLRMRPSRSTRYNGRNCSGAQPERSEEHTSELQSRQYLVCRLLLEKTKICSHALCSFT